MPVENPERHPFHRRSLGIYSPFAFLIFNNQFKNILTCFLIIKRRFSVFREKLALKKHLQLLKVFYIFQIEFYPNLSASSSSTASQVSSRSMLVPVAMI
jgi:hypothetical protein